MTVHVPSTSDVSTTLMNTHPCRYRHAVAHTNIAHHTVMPLPTHHTDHKDDFKNLNEIHTIRQPVTTKDGHIH